MNRLAASLSETPVVEREGYHYFVHPVSDGVPALDPALLREIVDEIVDRVDFEDVDAIVAPEAMGIHIATATSLATDVPMVIVRKRGYGLDGEVAVSQVTGYSESELYLNDVAPGDRVVVLDDVLSTGGTLSAVTDALRDVGAEIVDVVCVIGKVDEDGALADVDVPVQTLIDVDVVDGEVVVVNPDGSP